MSAHRVLAPFGLVVCLALSASAQDAKTNLQHAMQTLKTVPAYRMTVVSTEPESRRVTNVIYEEVNPNFMHLKSEEDGKIQMEMLTDGKSTYFRQGNDEKLQLAPAGVAAVVAMARGSISPEVLVSTAANVKLEGHTSVEGVPASVYTFDVAIMGVHSANRIWISDRDGRPLKMEGDTHGDVKLGNRPGRRIDKHSVITYDYDSSIKITLPSAG